MGRVPAGVLKFTDCLGHTLNAVEIEEEISELAEQPFDAQEFPFFGTDHDQAAAFGRVEPVRSGRCATAGSIDVPRFSQIARSYLIHIGNLDWTKINPDIFGSMIQAVAEDEERGALGMHYTSVPNILKVLNPRFSSTTCGHG